MTASLNRNSILWAISVMQPVSASELIEYLASVFLESTALPTVELLHHIMMDEMKAASLIRISRNPDLFSLTLKGHHSLTSAQRKSRDRERIFLLRASWGGRLKWSREDSASSLDGVAPSPSIRSSTEGSEARTTGPSVPQAQSSWPRHSKQLFKATGSSSTSRDNHIPLLSFMDPKQLVVARGAKGLPWADFTSLGLMLGISPQLILQIYARPDRHYRSFTIPKKDGNLRKIEAPRVFLKVIQKFIADYLLQKLPVHGSVHSFRHKRSIVTNASRHTGRRWVASIDIENFFNSISIMAIYRLMKTNGFDNNSARVIAALTTFMGHLPQGSPASPPISNAILYEFDMRFDTFCARSGLVYTRYADDITISGSNIHSINLAVSEAKQDLLTNFGLSLKSDKQRIISNCSQQRVTGVVVNEKAMPSRKFRREIRAALNNAINSSEISEKDFKRLSGYISYFKSFPQFISTAEFRRLESSLLLMSKQRLE